MKTLILDGNFLLMQGVFVWRKGNTNIPVSYYTLLQMFKWIKLYSPDKVYIAGDGGSSWRKEIYPKYKANRKELRDSYPDIPWAKIFADYSVLLSNLQKLTPITAVQISNIEGDDIISYLCRYNPTDEIIVVTRDKDIRQLVRLSNVAVASPIPKSNNVKLWTSIDEDILEDKVSKGDVSDNIEKATTFSEVVRNHILIDLINLPPIIDVQIQQRINSLQKEEDIERFKQIYPYKFLLKSIPYIVHTPLKEEQSD